MWPPVGNETHRAPVGFPALRCNRRGQQAQAPLSRRAGQSSTPLSRTVGEGPGVRGPGTSRLYFSIFLNGKLAEVYELDLKGCELAILSACETNVGPEQRGEGVWALSRGFLVAGSRRVVATQWVVEDEAAASTVSYLCAVVARQEQSGGAVDYAAAVHQAKRWVRSVKRWQNPYYWAPFILLGPN